MTKMVDEHMITSVDALVTHLREHVGKPVLTPHLSRNGTQMKTGDIIRFYTVIRGEEAMFVDAWTTGAVENIDVVEKIDNQFYAINYDTVGGAFLRRVNGKADIVGNIFSDFSALHELVRFRNIGGQIAHAMYRARAH